MSYASRVGGIPALSVAGDTSDPYPAAIAEGIRVSECPCCFVCGEKGALLYDALSDLLFGVEGRWIIRRCLRCRLAWLDPRPVPQDISRLYIRYYTHGEKADTRLARLRQATHYHVLARMGYPVEVSAKLLPRLLSRIPSICSAAELDVLGLPASATGTLLDVGCGNGDFVARMASLGWKASGVDPDPIAASQARGRGLKVSTGWISDIPYLGGYDVITMNHVIEHAADPLALLQECLKRLRPRTGRLVITTPNLESLGHRWFQKSWRGLEVPRHFVLFSPAALRQCVVRAGLRVHSLSTRTRLARMIYCPSICAKHGGREIGNQTDFPASTKIAAYLFQAVEDLSSYFKPGWGEEIFCVCIAPERSQETSP